jgi:hypothetical protein
VRRTVLLSNWVIVIVPVPEVGTRKVTARIAEREERAMLRTAPKMTVTNL